MGIASGFMRGRGNGEEMCAVGCERAGRGPTRAGEVKASWLEAETDGMGG